MFTDLLDGEIARATGRSSVWGAFLDSALDRFGDAAVFGALAFWYAGRGDSLLLCGGRRSAASSSGSITSYIKARAEALGLSANVGFAERAERLIIVLGRRRALRPRRPLPARPWRCGSCRGHR